MLPIQLGQLVSDHCRAQRRSQHVVNILTSGDPVNAGDVEKVEEDERNSNNTGLLAKGGPTAKVQVTMFNFCPVHP